MPNILTILLANPAFQSSFFLILIILNIVLLAAVFLIRRRFKIFLQGKNGRNLEDLVDKSAAEIGRINLGLAKINKRQEEQEKILETTIRKVGMVRFNPFKNTGGDQSFAIALLNSSDSGIVLSSLYLREGMRIYAKPIGQAKSKYSLSAEEEEAIKKAIG
ncbi:DUF4446 family protein [Patescibacteria group bacterium]|nr:DUF4446 family protein [Patescibacteria group bacterium]MBU3999625.1 DUF4446 family protein [Patescibacteria group bacterium]MBU4057101.1 DUF4446 family protein [Patescibacteria group bacterium]MBU4368479.1 DUF4446 family protein [Patescibacteria group bacterium]